MDGPHRQERFSERRPLCHHPIVQPSDEPYGAVEEDVDAEGDAEDGVGEL